MKAAFPDHEIARLATLRGLGILDTPPEPAFDDLARLAAFLCGTPVALITLVDEHRQWFKAKHGVDLCETPRDQAFCAHALLDPQAILVVPDATTDPRFADHPLVTGPPHLRFYAGTPLVTAKGHAVGTLCVIDYVPRTLTPEQLEFLRTLGHQVNAQIELRRQAQALRHALATQAQTTAALLESNQLLAESQQAARLGSYWYDLRNDQWSGTVVIDEIFGSAQPACIHNLHGWLDRVHPDEREEMRAYLQHEVIAARQPFNREYRIRRHDNAEERWLHGVGKLLLDDAGQPFLMVGTIQDITERKRTELAVENERHLLRTLIDSMPNTIYVKDTHSRFILANRAVAQRAGKQHTDEMIGRSDADFFPAEVAAQFRADEQQVMAGHALFDHEELSVSNDGSSSARLTTKIPFLDRHGKVCGLMGMGRDISDRKQAEEKLIQLLARQEKIATQVPGMIYQFRLRPDGTSCFPYASNGIQQIYQLTPAAVQASALQVFAVLHPDDAAAVTASIQTSARTLEPWHHEYRIRHADGVERWLSGKAVPEREADGGTLWHGFITDITERKEADGLMEQERRLLRTLIDLLPDFIYVKDTQHRFLIANQYAARLMGQADSSELLGHSDADFFPPELAAKFAADEARVLAGESLINCEEESLSNTGQRITQITTKIPFRDGHGNICGLVGLGRDITERKRAEEAQAESETRFRLLIGSAPDAVVLCVAEQLAYVNPATLKLLGADRATDLLNRPITDFIAPEYHRHTRRRFTELKHNDGELPAIEVHFVRLNKQRVQVEITTVPVEFNGQKAVLLFARDISERKKHEAKLIEARQAAEAASNAKSDFLATMSHEIRTPMNGVLGLANLLLETELAPKQRRCAEILRDSGNDLLVIINDILDFSKIEAGKLTFEPLPVHLPSALEEIVALLATKANKKNIELRVNTAPGTPAGIVTDRVRLRQVLLNLTDNAIKFTSQGHVHINVECLTQTSRAATLKFSVQDTGLGIPPDKQSRLFQKFSQADGSTTRKFGGTGLGLAICKQLVELMGGTIGLESVADQGSTFWFILPFTLDASAPPTHSPKASASGTETGTTETPATVTAEPEIIPAKPPARWRVLVAEDNPTSQIVAVSLLEKLNCRVDIAPDGVQAVALFQQNQYDLVFMDWHMPEMDGFEATAKIREHTRPTRRVPIIALTAGVVTGDREKFLAGGMDDCVSKPVGKKALAEVLHRWLTAPAAAAPAPGATEPPPRPAPVPPAAPLFDEAAALELVDGDRELLAQLAASFCENAPRLQENLLRGISRRDPLAVTLAAHTLKGSARMFAAPAAIAAATETEAASKAQDWSQIEAGSHKLLAALAQLLPALAQLASVHR